MHVETVLPTGHWLYLWAQMLHKGRKNGWHLCLRFVLVSFTFSHLLASVGMYFHHSRNILSPYKTKTRGIDCPKPAVTMDSKKNKISQDTPLLARWEQMWWASPWSTINHSWDIFRIWGTKAGWTSPDQNCWIMYISCCLPHYFFVYR